MDSRDSGGSQMNDVRHDYAARYSNYGARRRYLGNMYRACRSALSLLFIRMYDGTLTLGRYSLDHEPREWVRIPDSAQAKEARTTSIIRRRSLTYIKRSGYIGMFFLSIGMVGLVVSMFMQIPQHEMYLISGFIIGGKVIARIYGH